VTPDKATEDMEAHYRKADPPNLFVLWWTWPLRWWLMVLHTGQRER
jgi:hypothetical protein